MPSKALSHVDVARLYCEQVVSGKQVACKWTRLACQRQLDDLAREETDDNWPYYFDADAANRFCRFMELLPHVKGKWARRHRDNPTAHLIRLEPHQAFTFTAVFGWKRKEDGNRRFRTVYKEVARKNAKSTECSGLGLFMLGMDDEPGAEIYASATKRAQARIVFDAAREMAERSPEFRVRYGIEVFANSIVQPSTASKFTAIDAKASTQDGLGSHCAINDELHAHKSRALYDVIHSSMSARDQPLEWNITTAGSNRAGVCYELRNYLCKVLECTIKDESLFGVIYTLDADDDWTDEAVWIKANPNLGVSKNLSKMREDCHKAQMSAASQNEFLTKDLNIWVNADSAWMNMQAWDACANAEMRLDDQEGEACILSLDLASKKDIASKVYVFEVGEKYRIFTRHYLPSLAVEANPDYAGWVKDGFIIETIGNRIDLDLIEYDITGIDDVRGDAQRFEINELAFDPWQAAQMITHCQEVGILCVEVPANVRHFSDPMKELEALVLDGKIEHDGCPVMTWMISNVVCHRDAKDNIYPRKENPESKIDGPVALIMGLSRIMVAETPAESPWDTDEDYQLRAV